jgi:hypothetical protein
MSGYKGMQHLQSEWMADQRLVWQKRGAVDSLLYKLTIGATLAGIGYAVCMIVIMSFPELQKKK